MNTAAIEAIVRRIMEEQNKACAVPQKETVPQQPIRHIPKTESIRYDEASELLGENGIAAIANTMAMFRK